MNVFHASAVIRNSGPASFCVVSRTATRPGMLATSTQVPPCPPL
jgi:hypothetical protein